MSLDSTNDQSTLVQVMAWCHQTTNHNLSQCWPRSLSPYGVTRPQWVKMPWTQLQWKLKKTPSGGKINLICLAEWSNCFFEIRFSQSVWRCSTVIHSVTHKWKESSTTISLTKLSSRFATVEANLCSPASSEIRNTYSGALTWLDQCVHAEGK